jgi:hypothetical protein
LQELPSLKEFEALAREALGSDEGLVPPEAGDESVLDAAPGKVAAGEATFATADQAVKPEAAASEHAQAAVAPAHADEPREEAADTQAHKAAAGE